jgi:hypothetical protein
VRNFLITVLIAAAACAAAFGAFYLKNAEPAAMRKAAREGDAMAWLKEEFHLNDAQFSAIRRMHAEFAIACAGHCAAIAEARRRGASPAEIAGLEDTCVNAMVGHFRSVAALMPPGEGSRYLAIVLPRIADYDHRGSPTLQGRP